MARRMGWLAGALAGLMVVLVGVSSAGAEMAPDLQDSPVVIWDVGNPDETSLHTGPVRAIVRDMEEFEGHMYVAGKFLSVIAPDGTQYSQPYLARFDLETGEWDSTWRPVVADIVYAIEITPDGRLYVGGEMAGGAVLYDARSGTRVASFDPQLTNSWGPPAVFDVEWVDERVYLGGDFTEAQGVELSNLARVDAATGQLDTTWTPTADLDTGTPLFAGSLVFAIAVDDTRDRVYLAGKFGGINGDDSASYFAIIDPSDGSLVRGLRQGLPKGIPNHRTGFSMWMEDVQFEGERVYLGGNAHQTITMRASDLGLLSTFFTNNGVGQNVTGGDTQVIHIGFTTVWSGCHCWGSVGPFEIGSFINGADGVMTEDEYYDWTFAFANSNPFGQQDVSGAYGIDRATGRLSPIDFDLGGQAGAFAIVEDSNGRLWLGGQFQRVPSTGREISGIARFSPLPPPDVEPPADGDRPADDQITRLYGAVFGRAPDAGGFEFWTSAYANGRPFVSIADEFTQSPEWIERYGTNLSDAAYVDVLYLNVLGRVADEGGRQFWIDQLTQGARNRIEVLLALSDSPEYVDATGTSRPITSDEAQILRLYRAAFGRSPDSDGYNFWIVRYRRGQSLESIAAEFTQSTEWASRFGGASPTDEVLIDALYQNVLGRPADTQGRNFWLDELGRRSTASVLVAFSESIENVRRTGTPPAS